MNYLKSFFCVFFLASCGTIAPKKPESSIAKINPIVQPISYISVPIEINLKPYLSELEKQVPMQMDGKEEQCEGMSFSYRFQRKPIEFSGFGSRISYSVEGKYGLKINYCPKCTGIFSSNSNCVIPRVYASCGENGESMRRIKLSYETDLSLQKNWSLQAKTTLKELTPIDPCNITFVQYNATDHVTEEVNKQLIEVAKDIDKQIANYPLKKEIDGLWKSLQDPISMKEYGFLSIQPNSLGVKRIQFDQKKLNLQVVIGMQPVVDFTKPILTPTPTPPNEAPETPSDFNLFIDLHGTYDSINRLLATHLNQQSMILKGRTFVMDQVEIAGTNEEKFILKVQFSGNKKGTLFFQATPIIDSTGAEIRFKNVDFDLETKHVLMKSAKWILNKRITEKVENEFSYSLKKMLEDARKSLEKEVNSMNQSGFQLKGKFHSIQINSVVPQSDYLLLRANIKGNIQLVIP